MFRVRNLLSLLEDNWRVLTANCALPNAALSHPQPNPQDPNAFACFQCMRVFNNRALLVSHLAGGARGGARCRQLARALAQHGRKGGEGPDSAVVSAVKGMYENLQGATAKAAAEDMPFVRGPRRLMSRRVKREGDGEG